MNNPKQLDIITSRELEDQTIIIDLNGKRMFHQLNPSASFIWKLCDGDNSINDIVNRLTEKYDIDSQTAKEDVENTLSKFSDLSLIKYE